MSLLYPAFVLENKLWRRGFDTWCFEPGMRFGDTHTWWGAHASRACGHEGTDFRCFANKSGRLVSLCEGMRVPVAGDGVVLQFFGDFLGQSILIAHDLHSRQGQLYSIYAHVRPVGNIRLGDPLKAGQIIGLIAAGTCKVPAHLHISYLWLSISSRKSFAYDRGRTADWRLIQSDKGIIFTEPLDFLQG